MSISKRAAKWMIRLGIVGALIGLGGTSYEFVRTSEIISDSPPGVHLEEIAKERTQLGKDFDECIDAAENQLAFNDCYTPREKYVALGQEEEIKNSSEYKQLEEERDRHLGYSIGWWAFAIISGGVCGGGFAAGGNRRYEPVFRRGGKRAIFIK